MSGYSWVSVVSIFCYLFLLLTFIVAPQKKEKVIVSFITLLGIMLLWTGGSFAMRALLWPSVNFWHHVSLLGMLLLPYGYFRFVCDFLDENNNHGLKFWLVFYVAVFAFNVFTGFFIPLPEVVTDGAETAFLYHYTWRTYPLFGIIGITLVQMCLLVWRHCRGNNIAYRQLLPVIVGVGVMVLGHLLATLPMFVGLPLDMLSGAFNAIFLFYALYRKQLFRMTILLSKSNYGIVSVVLGAAIFSDLALVMQRFLVQKVGMSYTGALMLIAVGLVMMIGLLYAGITFLFDAIFTRKEQRQKNALKNFSEELSHMMSVNEILQSMSATVQDVMDISRLFVLVRGADGTFRIEHTLNPLEEKSFAFDSTHPLLSYLKERRSYVLFQDFSRKTMYRSMWEKEKSLLMNQQLECFIPMNCDNELIGFIMLSDKHGKTIGNTDNLRFLQSVADVCACAVQNAYHYEKAIEESQRDDMTGLINYKFFFDILEREFDRCRDSALSLCLINIDDFKQYNQLYGTSEGDMAIRNIASILTSAVNENGYAARINGDEFALVLPGYDIYSAKCLADNISEQISSITPSITGKAVGGLTVSIGICAAPYMASSARELYRNADTTVYTVKRTGKNAVQMFSADIHRREPSNSLYKSGYDEHASTIYALTAAVDAKDHYTFQHSQNVAYYASELAKAAGMSPDLVEIIREAGLLHDIGKIGIREEILNKPGRLTPDEFEVMKSHVENAVNIIRHLPSLDYVIPAVLSHHERYDGRGYPRRLAQANIPITGRILCVADSFDAIVSIRNYKDATPVQDAIAILRSEAGKQFDPNLVEIFVELVENNKIELRIPPSTKSPNEMPAIEAGD